jgi:hypothetical protein
MTEPFFIPLSQFKEHGLPGQTTARKLDAEGKLNLVKVPGCGVGIMLDEARRFFAAQSVPLAAAEKRDTKAATAASLRSRGARQ